MGCLWYLLTKSFGFGLKVEESEKMSISNDLICDSSEMSDYCLTGASSSLLNGHNTFVYNNIYLQLESSVYLTITYLISISN